MTHPRSVQDMDPGCLTPEPMCSATVLCCLSMLQGAWVRCSRSGISTGSAQSYTILCHLGLPRVLPVPGKKPSVPERMVVRDSLPWSLLPSAPSASMSLYQMLSTLARAFSQLSFQRRQLRQREKGGVRGGICSKLAFPTF